MYGRGFMKRQFKYMLSGQRLEKPAMEALWANLKDNNVFERNGNLESLY